MILLLWTSGTDKIICGGGYNRGAQGRVLGRRDILHLDPGSGYVSDTRVNIHRAIYTSDFAL